jgi:hypothetical protein
VGSGFAVNFSLTMVLLSPECWGVSAREVPQLQCMKVICGCEDAQESSEAVGSHTPATARQDCSWHTRFQAQNMYLAACPAAILFALADVCFMARSNNPAGNAAATRGLSSCARIST